MTMPPLPCAHPEAKRRMRGACWSCYQKHRRQTMPMATCHPQRKEHARGLCQACHRAQGLTPRARCHPDRLQHDKASGFCARCYAMTPDVKARRQALRRAKKYGLTEEEATSLLSEQGNTCAICTAPNPTHIDHDHNDGHVRGWLCHHCNSGLGFFRDNAGLLVKAVSYLQER
jgi:hypothetical protein